MGKKNVRVFIGPCEIGKIGGTLGSALKEKGMCVTVVRHNVDPCQYGSHYDVTLDFTGLNKLQRTFKRMCFAVPSFLHHDAFIFLFGDTLLHNNVDLPLLKMFGKRTIMWFVGSDIRSYDAVAEAAKNAGIKYRQSDARRKSPNVIERNKKMIRRVEKYVDHIITGRLIAHLLNRDYFGGKPENEICVPIDIVNIPFNNIPNARPVVVHAPTNERKKGTRYILEAVERLRAEGYDFDFELLLNMDNIKVREILSSADIVIDQLFAVGPGMLAVESMAAGCAVLGGNIPELSGYPKDEIPVIHTDPESLCNNLKTLLDNPQLRQKLGEKGRRYVEKYHDHRKVADCIIRLLTTRDTVKEIVFR